MADADLLIKLFDTLRESNKETTQISHALLQNQNDIGNYIKNLPMNEIKQLLKDHVKESSSEIDSCTETVEEKSDTILEEVKTIGGKIKTMIIIVLVAFSLFSAAALIGVIVSKNENDVESKKRYDKLIEAVNEAIDDKFKSFKEESDRKDDEILKAIESFHKQDKEEE